MATTKGFGKLEREMLGNDRLPTDLRIARVAFKNDLKARRNLVPFQNREDGLPAAGAGQTYYEYQVGEAHSGDAQPRGQRRRVALVDAGNNVLQMFFGEAHYQPKEWQELQYP